MLLHSYSTESTVINELMSLKELYKLTMHCSIGLHSSDLSTPQCWNLGDQLFYRSLEFLFIADFFFGNKWLLLAILPYIAGELWMWSVTAVASVQRQPWLQFHAAGCHFLLVLWSGCFDKKPYFMKWTVLDIWTWKVSPWPSFLSERSPTPKTVKTTKNVVWQHHGTITVSDGNTVVVNQYGWVMYRIFTNC